MHLLDYDSSPIQSSLYPSRYVHNPKDTNKYEHFIEHLVYIVVRDNALSASTPSLFSNNINPTPLAVSTTAHTSTSLHLSTSASRPTS
ncbi:hypothetical protein BHE74_00056958 [Ensete ventricosum]|nr:hypothetical protein BHE74_00056958 [Ensete ventricosum]